MGKVQNSTLAREKARAKMSTRVRSDLKEEKKNTCQNTPGVEAKKFQSPFGPFARWKGKQPGGILLLTPAWLEPAVTSGWLRARTT